MVIQDLTSPCTLYPQELVEYYMTNDETTKSILHWITKGLHNFVLSHELAHIAHGHVKADDSRMNSVRPLTSNYITQAIDEANNSLKLQKGSDGFYFHINRYSSHSSWTLKQSKENTKYYQRGDVTPELRDNVKRQHKETHADTVAFQSMWNMLVQNGYHDDIIVCQFIGAACFFWYQEYLERAQAIIGAKDAHASPSKLPNTNLAQNLFGGHDHPAPLTRYEMAVNMLSHSANVETTTFLMDIWEDVSIMFGGAWDQYAIPYLKTRIEQEDINLHSKWFDDIPFPEGIEFNTLGLIGARRYVAS